MKSPQDFSRSHFFCSYWSILSKKRMLFFIFFIDCTLKMRWVFKFLNIYILISLYTREDFFCMKISYKKKNMTQRKHFLMLVVRALLSCTHCTNSKNVCIAYTKRFLVDFKTLCLNSNCSNDICWTDFIFQIQSRKLIFAKF